MRSQVAGRAAGLLARLAAAEAWAAARGGVRLVAAGWQRCSAQPSSSEPSTSSFGAAAAAWQAAPARGFAASAAAEPAAAPPAADKAGISISDAAVARLKELGAGTVLRIMVEGGGCSGFQYEFSLDEGAKDDDKVFEREGVTVVCDDLSLEFLRGATVDYESDLMRSAFVINSNPNAASSCGCGSSFVAK